MASQAGDGGAQAGGARDGGDDADAQCLVQQHRALLDVRLDEGGDVFAAPVEALPCIGIAAEVADRLAHGDAVGIRLVEPGRVERAGHRLAADQGRTEAHAFFVAEADHFKRVGQALAARVQIAHAGNRGEDAVEAVVFAGVAHAVLV